MADLSYRSVMKSGPCSNPHDILEESDDPGSRWYFSRKEIEENSPSRRDGIDLKKEAYLRKSYCTFLQDLGMRLKVPQVTIATAIVFCHRFFLRQSHAKNDRRTIATVCMFLAGKVEETPRPLKDVILVSYEIIHKKDPVAIQKIKQKEVYEQQKELILLGERVVLATLGFDFNVHHPYKPLVEAIKKFKVAQNALAQVAWNFVNDGLRTSLCLQFKPHHIAAGAIFLAAKFLKVKLPSDGDKVWWQEFDVTPRQLEDVSNQMLELYEQNRATQSSHQNEVEGSADGGTNHRATTTPTKSENSVSLSGPHDVGMASAKHGVQVPSSRPAGGPSSTYNNRIGQQSAQNHSNDNGSDDTKSGVWDHNADSEVKDCSQPKVEPISSSRENPAESLSCSQSSLEHPTEEVLVDEKGKTTDGIARIDKDKVKAALEKRKKLRNDVVKKTDIMDDDDLIERELENGVEMAVEDEKAKQDRRHAWPKPLNRQQQANQRLEQLDAGGKRIRSKSFDHGFEQNGEEGELASLDEHALPSPKMKSKNVSGWPDHSERDAKRPRCESHG